MLLNIALILTLCGTISQANAAALLRHRQATNSDDASACDRAIVTIFQNVTVTAAPPAVTVVEPDANAISSSLHWVSSVEAEWLRDQAEMAPVSNPPETRAPTFVRTVDAPAFEVDKIPGTGSPALYTRKSGSRTVVPYSTITFTVSPIPKPAVHNATSTKLLTSEAIVTATLRHPFTTPTAGWNTSDPNSSLVDGVTGVSAGTGMPGYHGTGHGTGLTVAPTGLNTTSSLGNSTKPTGYGGGYGYHGYGYQAYSPKPTSQAYEHVSLHGYASVEPRQVCTLAYATINGEVVSWCNRYLGQSTALTYTSWESTEGLRTSTLTSGTTTTLVQTTLASATSTRTFEPNSSSSTAESTTIPIDRTSSTFVSNVVSAIPLTSTMSSLSSTTSSMTSTSATPTSCGETGAFQINFDNLPVFSANENTTDSPIIFNPYDHFTWSRGFSYAPPPKQPYLPESGARVAVFNPRLANTDSGSPNAGLLPAGSFGAGPRSDNDHYWFDADSMFVGCNTTGTPPGTTCDFVAEGYRFDEETRTNKFVVVQHFTQPACPEMQNCTLHEIYFNSRFTGLSTMTLYANVLGTLQSFWVDTVQLSWYNNTCEAGLERISSRKK